MFKLFSFRTMAIIKRELKAQVMTKTFIFTTIFVPIILVGLMGLQTFLMMFEDKKDTNIEILVENSQLVSLINDEYLASDEFNHDMFHIKVKSKSREELQDYIQDVKPDLLSAKINGVFFLPQGERFDKNIEYYSSNPKNTNITRKINSLINGVLVEQHFKGRSVSEEDIKYARNRMQLQNFKISEKY